VLVTGASKGIGLAIATHFLDEGANVFLVARGKEQLHAATCELISTYGEYRVLSESCDCTDQVAVEKLSGSIVDKWGGVDIVVENIGDGRSVPDPVPSLEHWQRTWNTNFESALLTTRVVLPMLQESRGCLLFISSITGLEAFGAPVDYSTAKSAIVAFSKNLARKVADKVRVNVIAPGNINFPGSAWDEKIKIDEDRVEQIIKTTVPMQRFGSPDEIASASVFLCSERASFITGSVMVVDGGQTVGVF